MTISAFPLDAVAGDPSYTGRMLRTALAAIAGSAPSGSPLGATSGVRPGTPSSTVSMMGTTWRVAPHAGILDVQASAASGPYLYAVTELEFGTINAAHATYTRWDGVYIQLDDPAEGDGTSAPAVRVVYVAGTASASPAMPTQPARSLLLGRIVVPQSGGGSPSAVWLAPTWSGDTDWLTAGVAVAGAAGFTINSYRLRKVSGGQPIGRILAQYSGSAITAAANGSTSTAAVLTMPAGWAGAVGHVYPVTIWAGGIWFGVLGGSTLTLRAGPPGQTFPTGSEFSIFLGPYQVS